MVDRTSIYQTLATIAPIFDLPQPVIVGVAANIHPLTQLVVLGGVRVDAIAVGKCQHPSSIARLLELNAVVNDKYKAVLEARGLKPNYSINTQVSASKEVLTVLPQAFQAS